MLKYFENWNRYYDPFTGRYVQPDPLLALDPVGAISNRTYSYGNNSPTTTVDPSGAFILKSSCSNWNTALALAKSWAGCPHKKCKCSKALECDICDFLEEGAGPEAYVKEWGYLSNRAHTNVGPPGSVYQGVAGHEESDSVAFAERYCNNAGKVVDLAELMIHEADQYCATKTGKPTNDASAQAAGKICREAQGE